jgi:hypothetical protein
MLIYLYCDNQGKVSYISELLGTNVKVLHETFKTLRGYFLYLQDYIEDNDSLFLLRDQIHDCDIILSQVGSLLSGFQVYFWLLV